MKPPEQTILRFTCLRMVRTTAALTASIGVVVLCGWAFDIGFLKSVLPGLATMKPFTAIGFILLGVSLGRISPTPSTETKIAARLCALAAGLIGLWVVSSYLWSFNTGLDTWLFPANTPDPHPGRMAPATALGFIIYSLSILLLDMESDRGRRPAQYLALAGTMLGLIPLMGYVYGVQALYRFNIFSSIALHTAFLFTILGFGVLCARPNHGLMAIITSMHLGGRMARRALPIVLFVPFMIGWLTLKAQALGWYGPGVGLALLITANVLFFSALIWLSARALNHKEWEQEQLRAQEQAAQTQNTLTLETISDAFVALDRDWRFVYVNARAGDIFGRPPKEVLGQLLWTVFPESEAQFRQDFERAMQTQQPMELEAYYAPFGRWLEIRLHPAPDRLAIFFHDISARKRSAAIIEGQRKVLEMVARAEPLSKTLDALLLFLESLSPDMICSILLLDKDGQRVRHGSAPHLPEAYTQAIDGAPIGPKTGSCGTAIYRREPVYVADIASDPLWADFKHLALPHGLLACWSTPIFDAQRRILGSFAIYHRTTGLPTSAHNELITLATDISAICIIRQETETALRRSEERYARAVHGTSDGIWDWDIRTNAEYLSPRWKALLGFTDDELPSLADSFFGRIHPDDLTKTQSAVTAHLEQHQPYDLEIRLQTKTKGYRWFRTRGQAEWDAEGTPLRMAGSLSDIHTRKEAQDALERERAQATTVLNSLSSHIAVVNRDGIVIAVNEAWLQFARENDAGGSSSVLPGINYLDIVASAVASGDSYAKAAHDGISQVLRGQREHFELEYPCDSPTQRRRFLMVVTALKNGNGAVLAHENITERALTQEALRDSAEFNRQIIAGAHEGIVVLDRNLRYTLWNPFMEELLGLPAAQVLGRHPIDLFPWVKDGGQLAAMERALQGETVVLPDSQRLKTGSKRISWLHAQLAPLRNANGEIIGVIATIADITVRKLAEQELRKSHAQLRALAARLQSVREEQSAHIAREIHDVLGQQLTALKLDLTWLKRRMAAIGDPALQTALQNKVVASVDLVDSTIKTVQKVATELRPGLLDKLGLTAALEHEVRAFAKRSDLGYKLELDPQPIDLEQIRSIDVFRVCQELLTNIARHAQARQVTVRLFRDQAHLHLEVIDDGRGISELELSAARSLGLLGMKERAALLGGTLDIRGTHGKGTIAQLTIPLNHTRENPDS